MSNTRHTRFGTGRVAAYGGVCVDLRGWQAVLAAISP
jgi:hypothetical protein